MHILSAVDGPISPDLVRDYRHLHISIMDMDDENILEHFPAAVGFIHEGLESRNGNAGVLVHCAMGKSRSATLIVAYLLWATRNLPSPPFTPPPPLNGNDGDQTCSPTHRLTLSAALGLLCQGRPLAEPNPGFQEQLQLYFDMDCPETSAQLEADPRYQRWLYRRQVEEYLAADQAPPVQTVRFEDEAGVPKDEGEGETVATGKQSGEIRCRKCRTTLARPEFVIEHAPKNKKGKKSAQNQGQGRGQGQGPCAHIFLAPLSWMRPFLSAPPSSLPPNVIFSNDDNDDDSSASPDENLSLSAAEPGSEPGALSGRLLCPSPRCRGETHVGKFAWQGMSCSCGEWVTPAFALARRSVDVIPSTARGGEGEADGGSGGGGGMGIRLPPGYVSGGGRGRGRGRM